MNIVTRNNRLLPLPERVVHADVSDAAIIQAAKQDPQAFAPIYERYVSRIFAYCLNRTNNRQDAEDLCSQVFSRALASLHTYHGGNLAAWLFRIAHNLIIDHYRKRRPTITLTGAEIATTLDTQTIEQQEMQATLRQLIHELPDEKQALLVLYLDEKLTSDDIGTIVGKSAGAVRVELHRIIKRLRQRYLEISGKLNDEA